MTTKVRTKTASKTEPKFKSPEGTINVRYVLRQSGNITNKRHVAYGGKLEGVLDEYPARMDSTGYYVSIFSDEEVDYLEDKLSLEQGDLNPHKRDGFYSKLKVNIGKEGLTLDLAKPTDYIKYKLLLSYTDKVSPDIFSTSSKRTFDYEIVRQKDVLQKATKRLNYNREAYKILGKIEDSLEQLTGAYRSVTGKRTSSETSKEWLVTQVGDLIDNNAKRFVEILTDPQYESKLFIEKAIDQGAIKNVKGLYYTQDGVELSIEGERPTLINAIGYLDNIENQDIKLLIESKIK